MVDTDGGWACVLTWLGWPGRLMSRGLSSHGGGDGTFLIRAIPLGRLLWVFSNAFVEISVLGTARLWQLH